MLAAGAKAEAEARLIEQHRRDDEEEHRPDRRLVEALKEKFDKIVLETEPDFLSEIAARRVRFYQRNGFEIINKDYIQPCYGEGKSSLRLFLMANFLPENLENSMQEIHSTVYQ